jgi:KaiC/GvpD/RAD55 family RecA-like ATPase
MAYDFEAIRAQYPLEEIVSREVQLRRAGANKIGCCPFHPDRTPSFVVYQDQTYHCFGCGVHGDVIDFVAGMKHVDTKAAISELTGGTAPVFDEGDRERRKAERRLLEEKQRRNQENAIQEARARWERALPVNGVGSAYLDRKKVAPYGARREADSLLLPIYDSTGLIQSLQLVPPAPGAKKLFHGGAPVAGGRMVLGARGDGPLVICEGFATGGSIQAATGHMVMVAFSKGNIAALAHEIREHEPARPLIIAADTDAIDHAFDVAERFGAKVAQPQLEGADGSDFNDQAEHYGLEDVGRVFAALTGTAETPLPLVWYRDIQPVLNGNWIVKNVIPAEAFATIIGHPGCGKSFCALDLSLHVAAGMPWQGRRVRQGLVIYLAAEGQRGQQNRVEAWRRSHGVEDLHFAMIPVAINLRDREADVPKLIQTVHAAVAAAGIEMVLLVVDTLNRTFGGGDENGAEMTDYVDNVGRLKAEFGCTVVIVHHIPKNAETVTERGHGSLRGAIETSLVVSSDQESGVRTLRCTKQKDAEDGWHLQFKLKVVDLGEDEDGDPVTSCVVAVADDEMAACRSRGPNLSATQRQVYQELLATLEAAPVSMPRDIPDDVINRGRVGKVVSRKVWRDRWIAIGGQDKAEDVAAATFRRAVTDLQNKRLVGLWNDHAWATHE